MPVFCITKTFFDHEDATLSTDRELSSEDFASENFVDLIEELFFYSYEFLEQSLPFVFYINDAESL